MLQFSFMYSNTQFSVLAPNNELLALVGWAKSIHISFLFKLYREEHTEQYTVILIINILVILIASDIMLCYYINSITSQSLRLNPTSLLSRSRLSV